MTPGDVTIDVEFTHTYPDKSNANLSAVYASTGKVSPDFTKDNTNYTITVPFGTAEFSVSAQAENPYLAPVMLAAGGDNLLDADLMSPQNGGPLPEGSSSFGITVTSEDGFVEKTYSIDVILLPDLSLKTFQVTKAIDGEDDFVRDMDSLDTQDVYLPYAEGITLIAEAEDPGASVEQVPGIIPTLNVGSDHVTVTVTVSKSAGAAGEYSKDYVLKLYYGAGMDPDPLAEGGFVSFIPGEDAGSYYEIHIFNTPGDHELSFLDASLSDVQADILVIGGGGGGGVSAGNDCAGGGGAGGALYQSARQLALEGSTVTVTVGRGGGSAEAGESSSIGDIAVPGGGRGGSSGAAGGSGASGGGGGAGDGETYSIGGTSDKAGNDAIMGHNGADGSTGIDGGGGGGAGSPGIGAVGGDPWAPADEAAWVKAATGTAAFSRGGDGGGYSAAYPAAAGVNYGDGGSATQRHKSNPAGGAGHSGIVIVRFRRTAASE